MKQRGSFMAKRRILCPQFAELFRANLFFNLARHANKMAEILLNNLRRLQYRLTAGVDTNQIFFVMPRSVIRRLQERLEF